MTGYHTISKEYRSRKENDRLNLLRDVTIQLQSPRSHATNDHPNAEH